ncbi:MAG: PorT family protein [candidate division KSB1 bacterium]|nr:PorT family protein [candidate division KSB1 bacterium]MDZ7399506.1 PorT family protein [candidate division KSB1 bacterium]
MKKIKILFALIFIAFALWGGADCQTQRNTLHRIDLISSLKYPPLNKNLSVQPSITFASASADQQGLSTFEKILNVPLGIILGSFAGYLIGSAISTTDEEQRLVNRIKGGLIGAFAGPFVNYEILLKMKDVNDRPNRWYLKAGGNVVFPNHDAAAIKPGYAVGLSDYFTLGRRFGLQGDFIYQSRQFRLPNQKILYSMIGYKKVETHDINFCVGYFDISLLLNFKLLSHRNASLNLAIGPSLAIELHDNTKFHFIREEDNVDDWDFSYIMMDPAPLFGYAAMSYHLELQRGHWLWQLGFHHSVYDTDEIYPLDSNTRLRTVELSVGYKL